MTNTAPKGVPEPKPQFVSLRVAYAAVLARVEEEFGVPLNQRLGLADLSFDPTGAHYGPSDDELESIALRDPTVTTSNIDVSRLMRECEASGVTELERAIWSAHRWLMQRLNRNEIRAIGVRRRGCPDGATFDGSRTDKLDPCQWSDASLNLLDGSSVRLYPLIDYRNDRYFIRSLTDCGENLFEADWLCDIRVHRKDLLLKLRCFDKDRDAVPAEHKPGSSTPDEGGPSVMLQGNHWQFKFRGRAYQIGAYRKSSAILAIIIANPSMEIDFSILDGAAAALKVDSKINPKEILKTVEMIDCGKNSARFRQNLRRQFQNSIEDKDFVDGGFRDYLMNFRGRGQVTWGKTSCRFDP